MDEATTTALVGRGLSKTYGGEQALAAVDLEIEGGRVHGVIGRNGAGKSTLVKLLTGRERPDAGEVIVNGSAMSFRSVRDGADAGIVAVPQELVTPAAMSVREVITLGAEPRAAGFVRRRAERQVVSAVLRELDADYIDIDAEVASLPLSWQRIVLVAQFVHREAQVIFLDEPTAAMNAEDAERVNHLVRRLRERGRAIVYISHRFSEVEQICDVVTVLRDGRKVGTLSAEEINEDTLVGSVMGEDAAEILGRIKVDAEARRAKFGEGDVPPLQIEGVTVGTVRDFDLTVRPGEIVGLAGLPGSGVEDVFRCLSGERRPTVGAARVGKRTITDPASALRAGVAFLPGSRGEATLAEEPVLENLALASLSHCASHGFMSTDRIRSFADPVIARLGLRPVAERRMNELSGGNQQRVLVGSRILSKPQYLVLEDPTVGVDVAARGDLHGLIADLAAEGMGVVVGSSDPQELVDICDSVIVLREGRGHRTLSGATATEFAVVEAMATTRGERPAAGSRN